MNAFSNFVANKFGTFNEKDQLWMSKYLQNKLKWYNETDVEYLNKK